MKLTIYSTFYLTERRKVHLRIKYNKLVNYSLSKRKSTEKRSHNVIVIPNILLGYVLLVAPLTPLPPRTLSNNFRERGEGVIFFFLCCLPKKNIFIYIYYNSAAVGQLEAV